MGALASLQQGYSRFDPEALAPLSVPAAPRGRERGFAAYRNHVGARLADVLGARFPVIRRLVGDESFRAMARRYIASNPLRAAPFRDYGETFPRFIRSQGNSALIEYVADIAELEMLQGKACHAADARPLSPQVLASLRTEKHDGLTISLRSRTPAAELVARPFLDVEVSRLPGGGYPFISALSKGRTIAAAMRAGTAAAQDFDIDCNLTFLIDAKIIVDIGEDA